MTGTQPLAHVGPLGHHDMWIIVPMVLLSIIVLIVMARPKRPTADDDQRHRGDQAGVRPPARKPWRWNRR